MPGVDNSEEIQTEAAVFARHHRYGVHHDLYGWYVIGPNEREPASGRSLGFDGRRHYDECTEAWLHAQKLAARHAKREGRL